MAENNHFGERKTLIVLLGIVIALIVILGGIAVYSSWSYTKKPASDYNYGTYDMKAYAETNQNVNVNVYKQAYQADKQNTYSAMDNNVMQVAYLQPPQDYTSYNTYNTNYYSTYTPYPKYPYYYYPYQQYPYYNYPKYPCYSYACKSPYYKQPGKKIWY